MTTMRTLLTGATGFVGGRLLPRLAAVDDVRCLVRDASRLDPPPGVEVIEGDLGEPADVARALDGVECVYYLVHSMEAGVMGFAERDQELARSFCKTAGREGVRRAIYLGGVLPVNEDASSEHLRSRLEVERILGQNVEEFVGLRASMIVGPESASFSTLVQMVDRLPALPLPTWRDRRTQPVAVDDVIAALLAARTVTPGVYDIAGPDELSFEEMTQVISELLGKRRPVIDLPLHIPQLEGAVAAAVTDQDRELVTPLMEGLDEDLLVRDNALPGTLGVTPTPFAEAARAAIAEMDEVRAA
jgi:uncharacterized protein YbjT (DUF2867 family)